MNDAGSQTPSPDLQRLKIDRSGTTRRKRRGAGGTWLPRLVYGGGGLLLLALVALFWGPISRKVDQVRLPRVKVIEVVESDPAAAGAVTGMAANGYVVAARRAALSADTPGRIVEMLVTEGSVVEEGQVVARLYSDEYAAALERTKAGKASAESSLARSRAAVVAARAEVARNEAARKAAVEAVAADKAEQVVAAVERKRVAKMLAEGVATQRELDAAQARIERADASLKRTQALLAAAASAVATARSQAGVARADVGVAQARLAEAEAARAQAEATLKKTEVRAPFAGIVVLKDAEVGEVVSPNVVGGSSARGSVVTMVDFDSLEVQADVPETSLKAVRVGGAAQIFLDAYPGEAYPGRVSRIWPTANRQKATVEVRVSFLKRDRRLRPEMGVRIVFLPEKAEGAAKAEAPQGAQILLPEGCVVRIKGEEGVFVLERDVATFRRLQLGSRKSGKVEVVRGLEPGERVVLDPPTDLESGQRVLPAEG